MAQKFASFYSAKDREHVTRCTGTVSQGSLLQPLSSFEGRVFVLGLEYRSHQGRWNLETEVLGEGMELETVASVVSGVSRLLR